MESSPVPFTSFNNASSPTTTTTVSEATFQSIAQGTFHNACFASFQDGSHDGHGTVLCATYGVQGRPTHCVGWARNDAFGAACRKMCQSSSSNTTACKAAAEAYCGTPSSSSCTEAATHDPACGCLRPDCAPSAQWGTTTNNVTFEQFQSVLDNNKDLGWIAPQCLWHACANTLYANSVLGTEYYQDPKVCPNYGTIKCLAKNLTVSINNTQSQGINILEQQCGSGGIQGSSTDSSSSSLASGWAALPMYSKVLIYIGAALACIVCAAMFFGWRMFHARRAALHEASQALYAQMPATNTTVAQSNRTAWQQQPPFSSSSTATMTTSRTT